MQLKKLLLFCICFPSFAIEQTEISAKNTEEVERIVISARQQQQTWLNTSASITSVDLNEQRPALDLSRLLQGIPGLQADQRPNMAQDSRFSIRGFGARSSFGVRGIEVTLDGIPWSTADGQSQPGSLPLAQLSHAEILRGPFASLYGNASGGLLALSTQEIAERSVQLQQLQSRYFSQQLLQVSGQHTELMLTQLHHDGFRQHNSAKKRQASLRQQWQILDEYQFHWRFDATDDPLLQDPLGLTPTEWRENPSQTAAVATLFNTQKTAKQQQFSSRLIHDAQQWQLGFWHGQRQIRQYLGFTGDALTSSGGIVDLTRHFSGLQAQKSITQGAWWLQISSQIEQHQDQRLGFVNQRGRQGDLRRDELGSVDSADLALRTHYETEQWLFSAGARYSRLQFKVEDFFIQGSNPDDSGKKSDDFLSYAVGVTLPFAASWSLSFNHGLGYESPTLTEMAYSVASPGLNLSLEPAKNKQMETSLKYQAGSQLASIDLFSIQSNNELIVAQSVGGRTSFRNAASSSRYGAEIYWQNQWDQQWQTRLSSTFLQADFSSENQQRQLPGVARVQHFIQLEYQASDLWTLIAQFNYRGKLWVDDLNLVSADAMKLLQLDSRWDYQHADHHWQWWLSLENVFNKNYVSAVVVNQSNGRSFEPGTPRQWVLGLQYQWQAK